MRALIRHAGRAAVVDRPAPEVVPPGHVRLAVLLGGVCRTDVFVARGELGGSGPRVLGHEICARVLEPSVDGLDPGDLVAVAPALGCGACAACGERQPLRCPDRRMLGLELDGAFAEQVVLPRSMLHRVPTDLDLRRAAYAEPVAAALGAAEAPIDPAARGLVHGDNRIARLTALVLRALGFDRLDVGPPAGADRYDFVVETSPSPEALATCLDAVAPGGKIVLKSRPAGPAALPLARAVQKQVDLHARSYGRFEAGLDLLGRLELEPLFGEVHELEDFERAFEATLEATVKTFLRLGR